MPRLSKIGAACLAAFGWTSGSSVTASYLVVAGGGGGGGAGGQVGGGGGGAGGYLTGTTSLNPTLSYTITVGAGGGGAIGNPLVEATSGSSSTFNAITSAGGGRGGSGSDTSGIRNGANGGSGGGGATDTSTGTLTGTGGTGNTPTTSPSQGNNGGTTTGGASSYPAAGGGGSNSVGANNPSGSAAGNGGSGTASSISGTSVTYAGGGGGGARNGTAGTASGGGGAGSNSGNATAGTANFGGGGGGGGSTAGSYGNGGSGGSGVVIISYVGAQQFGGGVVTSSGGNTIHTFTTSGTLSPLNSLTANFLVVAGGGSGGSDTGGGGGAGGYRTSAGTSGGGASAEATLTIDSNSIYLVTVGAGGAKPGPVNNGINGSNSSFYSVTSIGGGGGGTNAINGASGGSGGGAGYSATGGAGTSNQGYAGGSGGAASGNYPAGGGGGAGSVGSAGSGSTTGGNGGNGVSSSISGTAVVRAGGGGGGTFGGGTDGTGGTGGGGNAGASDDGDANTGSGGGGSKNNGNDNGAGGSGIVIISYPGSTQQMAGGTVTVAGGNVIHTFTSSGYLAPIYSANNSLRFRASVSAYLNRTPPVASNRKTWTWSAWVKRGGLSSNQSLFAVNATGDYQEFRFTSSDNLRLILDAAANNYAVEVPTVVWRDPAAWYHIVLAVDTTQATSTNRVKIYVNGIQQTVTALSGFSLPAQNFDTYVNATLPHAIGNFNYNNTLYFDGYMTEIQLIDGQALTPNSFGTFNSYGVWQPITYGGSYGTNGFYLPFNSGTSTFVGSYNGTTAWFNAANNAAFAFGTGSLTIEAWVYPTQNSYGAIFDTRSTGSGGPGVSIYANSGNGIILVNNTTYNPSTYLSLNQWSHIAAVRNGASSWTVYINGNSVLTFTDSSNLTDNACFSGKNYAGTFFFSGAISNLRVVKGTAVYTSNFTLPTSPLTNISGTSLLTLQNSTLIDNSTNAFSLTNTGPITLGTSYPFSAAKIFNDQSPQGNNWTPNNISGITGSTLDYMTDVPTLTSTTVANYAVLNPLDKLLSPTVVDGNLGATVGDNAEVRGSIYVSSGKWYWEIVPTTMTFSMIGVGIGGSGLHWGTTGVSYYGANGNKYVNGSASAYGASYTNNDVIGIALDLDNLQITFYKNNTSQGTITGLTAGLYTPALSAAGNSSVYNANFGQRPFAYTAPSGFLPLNTFNL